MISDTPSRLAIAAILLFFASIIFAIELLVFAVRSTVEINVRIMTSSKRITLSTSQSPRLITLFHHLAAPILVGLLGAVLTPIAFAASNREYAAMSAASSCSVQLDADIGGDGIRIAIWVQEAVLILLAILGTFHSSATGVKEIGAGLAITHVSLAVALLVQKARGTLSSVDALLGAMILDSQNSALSIQFVSKETLAARWQVAAITLCQVFGLAVLPILVEDFQRGRYASEDCRCFTVFWWSWLDNCSPSSTSREAPVFWTYYACRIVAFAQCSFYSSNDTWKFHAAEKFGEPLRRITRPKLDAGTAGQRQEQHAGIQNQDRDRDADQGLKEDPDQAQNWNQNHEELHRQLSFLESPWDDIDGGELRYHDYPASITLMYTVYSVFALASMAAAETAMRELGLHPSSQVFSVGQIIAIVVAAATVLRAAYLFWKLFHVEWNKFVWPFSLGVAREVIVGIRRRTYMLLPPPPPPGAEGGPIPSVEGRLIFGSEHHTTTSSAGVDEITGVTPGLAPVTGRTEREQANTWEGQPDSPPGRSFPVSSVDCRVRIGNIIQDSGEVYKPLNEEAIAHEAESSTKTFSSFEFDTPERAGSNGMIAKTAFSVNELRVISFTPTDRKIAECTEDATVSQALKRGPVYMITGLVIASGGLEMRTSETRERGLGFRIKSLTPKILLNFHMEQSSKRERSEHFRYEGDVVLAYRLHPIRRRRLWRRSEVCLGPPFESKDAVL